MAVKKVDERVVEKAASTAYLSVAPMADMTVVATVDAMVDLMVVLMADWWERQQVEMTVVLKVVW